jgi:serine/threonine protein kinase
MLSPLLPDESVYFGDYHCLGVLGEGGLGTVYVAHRDSRPEDLIALRVPRTWDRISSRRFSAEAEAIRRAHGRYFPELIKAEINGDPPWLAMALIHGLSISDLLRECKPFPESSIWRIGYELSSALSLLKEENILHRDITPMSVLLTRSGLMLSNFDMVRFTDVSADESEFRVAMGTFNYAAPEQVLFTLHEAGRSGAALDTFGLGATLLYTATGHPPRSGRSYGERADAARNEDADLSGLESGPLRELISACLLRDPAARPSLSAVLTACERQVSAETEFAGLLPRAALAELTAFERQLEALATGCEASSVKQSDSLTWRRPDRGDAGTGGHVFISYARPEDSEHVDRVQRWLAAAGVPVWRDTDKIGPGDSWHDVVRRAIVDDSLVFLACFSALSLARERRFQFEELTMAIEQMRIRRPDARWFIPVRFDDCEIPDYSIDGRRTLRSFQYTDLFGDETKENTVRLVEAIRGILGLPDPAGETKRLIQLAAEEAALSLETTPAEVAADILSAMLQEDESRAMSLLALLSHSKADEIIAALPSAPTWLTHWPAASRAVSECAAAKQAVLGPRVGPMIRAAASKQGTQGYRQKFKLGYVHWSSAGGARSTAGPIADRHATLGGSGGRLGFPVTEQGEADASPASGAIGQCQQFEGPRTYSAATCRQVGMSFGATVYLTAGGTHFTSGDIGEYHQLNGGTGGWLGLPETDQAAAGPSGRAYRNDAVGWYQTFEGAMVYLTPVGNVIAVVSDVADYHQQRGGTSGKLGFPVGVEQRVISEAGAVGRLQHFDGPWDYPQDILVRWHQEQYAGGAAIYASLQHGIHAVSGDIGVLHEQEGGAYGWLGFPVSEETDGRAPGQEQWCCYQHFEGGTIYWKKQYGAITVRKDITNTFPADGSSPPDLGFPVTRESHLAGDNEIRIQLFEHGVITIRVGVARTWR